MRSLELFYVILALAHPMFEVIETTSLRLFLNKRYYNSGLEDFPVKKRDSLAGSVFVAVVLLSPFMVRFIVRLLWPDQVGDARAELVSWYVVLGLVFADSFQHAFHLAIRPRDAAPWVHLVTILIVLVLALRILRLEDLLLLVPGALPILLNWVRNSRKVDGQSLASIQKTASPPAVLGVR